METGYSFPVMFPLSLTKMDCSWKLYFALIANGVLLSTPMNASLRRLKVCSSKR
jgi:hypothetical protein